MGLPPRLGVRESGQEEERGGRGGQEVSDKIMTQNLETCVLLGEAPFAHLLALMGAQ